MNILFHFTDLDVRVGSRRRVSEVRIIFIHQSTQIALRLDASSLGIMAVNRFAHA
jgi:hypothetical protein